MSPARQTLLVVGLLGASACPNPGSAPPPRLGPPPVEGDTPPTAAARHLARLLAQEARGRLPRDQRGALATALRTRAAEWEALGAPSAALADLRLAETLQPRAPDPARITLGARIHRALGDRALARGDRKQAQRLFQKAAGAAKTPLARWRRAALEPQSASLPDLGRAVLRLHRGGPEMARRLVDHYLARGGTAPEVLIAGLFAAREHPDRSVARRALGVLLATADPSSQARGCALLEPEERGCRGVPRPPRCSGARPRASTPLGEGRLPLALERTSGAARARVVEAHRRFGERLHRWNLAVPPPGSAWPEPLLSTDRVNESWALVARGAATARRSPDPLHLAVFEALEGHLDKAMHLAGQVDARPGDGSRLLARLQALSGRRRAAAETLLGLGQRSPGGVTWLLPSLEDLGVLGLAEPALSLATPLVEAAPEDPVVLRTLTGLFVAIGEGDRAVLLAERWASLIGDPTEAYRFTLERFARAGDARRTARFCARLLEWTGGAQGPSRRAVARALRRVGRSAEAATVEGALAQGEPSLAPPPWRGTREGSPEAELTRLALHATVTPSRRSLALTFLAAALADQVGQASRARRILADAWLQDPDRFSAASHRRLAGVARGRRLFGLLPWARILEERACP